MLTPILTVKTVTSPAAAIPTGEVPAKETVAPKQAAQSGQRSEAALRILETLNRHLVGTEVLPKEALVRLLDTLSRLLKVEPLPQESLRDFGKRIAAAIETLPPAARLALEKQLGQRNLTLSVRVLAEIVKAMPLPEASRRPDAAPAMPQRSTTDPGQTGVARTTASQANGQALPQPQPRLSGSPVPAQPLLSSLQSAAFAFVPGGFDAGALQAALRSAFNVDEELRAIDRAPDDVEDSSGEPTTHDATTRSDRPTTSMSAMRQASGLGGEAIPTLHAVVRFLASDPETLAQVIAIASGDIDEELFDAVKQALEMDLPLETAFPGEGGLEIPTSSATGDLSDMASSTIKAEEPQTSLGAVAIETEEVEYAPYDAGPDAAVGDDIPSHLDASDGTADVERWQAQDKAGETASPHNAPSVSERTARTIADALKTLIEVGMPLSSDGLNEPLEQLLADFALSRTENELPASANGKSLSTGSTPARDDLARDLPLTQDMPAELDTAEREAAPTANRTMLNDDVQRDSLPQRLPEALFLREGIPFLAMPVPGKSNHTPSMAEEEEWQDSGRREDEDASGDDEPRDNEAGERRDNSAEELSEGVNTPNENVSDSDTYALYSRLGGFS
ncbi:hypothetical protein QO002_000634 [Pararhizobium capsulatum DSM 1112]|uniref:Uncharacterized protein n=1 Tax=Pararhizobium capsulatum DSM 1112 TaxID=1121113 RepID=A0ABU0BJR4_9HYPH|nr:hypothetical protein [Pararhizobium capsulatum]MDQ0318496.1 hypothetical protein [Pararhizobium capsulatum DSM 1112]